MFGLVRSLFFQISTLLSATLLSASAFADPVHLNLYTQEFPPLQVKVQGRPEGYVTNFVQALVRDASQSIPMQIAQVHFMPWKRAIRMTQMYENNLFFSISRTPEREQEYQWIGEVSPYEVALYRYKDGPNVAPKTLKELGNFRFGVQAESSFEELLDKFNITNTIQVGQGKDVLRLLRANRVDFAPLVTVSYPYRMAQYGLNPDDFVEVMKVRQLCKELWLVTGNKTSPAVVNALRNSYQKLRSAGLREKLIAQYQPDSEVMARYQQRSQ